MGRTYYHMIRAATGLPYLDTQCGFKLFSLPAARVLFERQIIDGFAYDVEILLRARAIGLRVIEVPVRWADDPRTKVKLVRSSARMAFDLVRARWHTRHEGRHLHPAPVERTPAA